MIPLKDDAPRISTPYLNYTLIALNTLAFLFEVSLNNNARQGLVFAFGMVPARFTVVLLNHGYVPWNLISGLGTQYVPAAAAIVPRTLRRSRLSSDPPFTPSNGCLMSFLLHLPLCWTLSCR